MARRYDPYVQVDIWHRTYSMPIQQINCATKPSVVSSLYTVGLYQQYCYIYIYIRYIHQNLRARAGNAVVQRLGLPKLYCTAFRYRVWGFT